MSLNWTDGLGIARRLNDCKDYQDRDLMMLDLDSLENLILSSDLADAPLAAGDARQNTLQSILWYWIRLRGGEEIAGDGDGRKRIALKAGEFPADIVEALNQADFSHLDPELDKLMD